MAERHPDTDSRSSADTYRPGDTRAPGDARSTPAELPRGTGEVVPIHSNRPTGTQRAQPHPAGETGNGPLRTLIYAPEATRLAWIESELSRAPIKISIQVGRRVRNVVAALLKDPPPRPEVLIVDFDAVSPGELLELHAVRHDGWFGKLIGLGIVPPELCESLGVTKVLSAPLIRDSLLDSVAGTTHAAITRVLPVFPKFDEPGEAIGPAGSAGGAGAKASRRIDSES